VIEDPINEDGGKVVVLPALNPDVALIHAQYAGEQGTIRINGLSFADIEQAKAALGYAPGLDRR
jgi:glutaconate CoA-transferase subunit A